MTLRTLGFQAGALSSEPMGELRTGLSQAFMTDRPG